MVAPEGERRRMAEKGLTLIGWQSKLLPVMALMLVLLTAYFCVSNIKQVELVQDHIQKTHEIDLTPALNALQADGRETASDRLNFSQWKTRAVLEAHALECRYHQASVLLMSRVYTIYLGFITGMILALVGATFILGKMRETEAKVAADSIVGKFSIASVSPGLILVLLGTTLMMTTVVVRTEVKVDDQTVYIPYAIETSQEGTQSKPASNSASDPTDFLKKAKREANEHQ